MAPVSNSFRAWTSSGGRRRLPTTSARNVFSCAGMPSSLRHDSCRHPECGVGGGHPAVDRRLEQDLLQLVHGDPVRQGRPHVKSELLIAIECDEHRDSDAAARAPVETRSRPDLTPYVARDEILELIGEGRARALHAIDVSIANTARRTCIPLCFLSVMTDSSRNQYVTSLSPLARISRSEKHGLA